MVPLGVDPSWYESYWYGERPVPRRRLGKLLRLLAAFVIRAPKSLSRRLPPLATGGVAKQRSLP